MYIHTQKGQVPMPVYLDCNATTQIEPAVLEEVIFYLRDEYGNSGSRSHEFGSRAKKAVEKSRRIIADLVHADSDEVIFTSGATESNNIAILGLADLAKATGKIHIVTTAIEHKAILNPLKHLETKGFSVTYLKPNREGWISADAVKQAITKDTFLLSVMHVNNETGVIQPLEEIAAVLPNSQNPEVIFHTDAAQGFGKEIETLKNKRIDLISISGHKFYGPMGVGALVIRKRGKNIIRVSPLMYGGGQERKIRPGTVPVPLVAGLGKAASLAQTDYLKRREICLDIKAKAITAFQNIDHLIVGDPNKSSAHLLNISFKDLDAEAVLIMIKSIACASTGSACTSGSYEPSHVLKAMELEECIVNGAIRFSWSHLTEEIIWEDIAAKICLLA